MSISVDPSLASINPMHSAFNLPGTEQGKPALAFESKRGSMGGRVSPSFMSSIRQSITNLSAGMGGEDKDKPRASDISISDVYKSNDSDLNLNTSSLLAKIFCGCFYSK